MALKTTYEELEQEVQNLKKTELECRDVEQELRYQTRIHKILMNIAASGINIPLDRVHYAFLTALGEMGKFVSADHAFLYRIYLDKNIALNTHEWCREGVKPLIQNLQKVSLNDAPLWVEHLLKGDPLIGQEGFEPTSGGLRYFFEQQQIKSLILIPIFHGKEHRLIGCTGFAWEKKIHVHSDNEIEMYKFFGQVIVNLRIRYKSEKKLENSRFQLKTVLNNLDSFVYISDMKSYEILFMNDYMKKVFGEDLTGKICWQSFHNHQTAPCEFCTNDKLVDADGTPKKPYKWEIYNKKLKKWFQLSDQAVLWDDGRLVRMEMAVDITRRKKIETKLIGINKTLDKKVKDRTYDLKRLNEHLTHSDEQMRRQIASELHDSVIQNLALSIFKLKNIQESGASVNTNDIIKVKDQLEQSVREIRSLIYQLSPPILDDFEIDIALGALIEGYNKKHQTNIKYTNHTNEYFVTSHTVKVVLYRSVNELIVNMIKHSGSKRAEVELSEDENNLFLKIEDHGVGFDLNQLKTKSFSGFGIQSISERINSLEGKMELFSKVGKGMKIIICLSKTA